ncbi:unnamed protein product [Boreogadus saida]
MWVKAEADGASRPRTGNQRQRRGPGLWPRNPNVAWSSPSPSVTNVEAVTPPLEGAHFNQGTTVGSRHLPGVCCAASNATGGPEGGGQGGLRVDSIQRDRTYETVV